MALPSTTPSGSRSRRAREQARGDGVLDQRRRRESRTEHLERERDIEQPRAAAAHVFGEGDTGRARGDELLPEVGRVTQRLVRADVLARAEAFGDRREEVDQRGLFVAQLEIHSVLYNIPAMLERTCLAPHAVARWAAETPDAVALQHVDGDALTYAELHDQGRAWAAAFEALGVRAGDHVATLLPNTFDSHRALLALGWLARGRSAAQHRLRRAHARLHRRPLRRDDAA